MLKQNCMSYRCGLFPGFIVIASPPKPQSDFGSIPLSGPGNREARLREDISVRTNERTATTFISRPIFKRFHYLFQTVALLILAKFKIGKSRTRTDFRCFSNGKLLGETMFCLSSCAVSIVASTMGALTTTDLYI